MNRLQNILNSIEQGESISIQDFTKYREQLKKHYEYYAYFDNDPSTNEVVFFYSIDDVNYYIDNQFNYWSDEKEVYNYFEI